MASSTTGTRAPFWLVVLITISGTLAMHMFVPALPDATGDFGANIATMQMTISLYIFGLAVGQLIYGPLSDSFGRRPLLLIGLGVYTVAGLAAALASSAYPLITARLCQALGGCAGLALGRAIVRDTAPASEAVRDFALLSVMMMVSSGVAPLTGSLLSATFGWRSIFALLAAFGAVTLAFTWRLLPETASPTGSIKIATLRRDYGLLLRSASFVGFTLGGGCATTSIYAFIAAAPFIVSVELHRPVHEAGLYIALIIVGMPLGNTLMRHLIRKVAVERILIGGCAVSVLSAFALLLVVLIGELTVARVFGLAFVFALGVGISSPAALAKALAVDAKVVGSAAGLYGFSQMAVAGVCTSLVGIGQSTALVTATVLSAAAALGQACFWLALRWQHGR